jgi:hypothetical protein
MFSFGEQGGKRAIDGCGVFAKDVSYLAIFAERADRVPRLPR